MNSYPKMYAHVYDLHKILHGNLSIHMTVIF
jgi:hypothetical protein